MKAIYSSLISGVTGALLVFVIQGLFEASSRGGSNDGSGVVDCLRAKRIEIVDNEGTIRASLGCRIVPNIGQFVDFTLGGGKDPRIACAAWTHSCMTGRNAISWYDPTQYCDVNKLVLCEGHW
jgi:hypothetical protein